MALGLRAANDPANQSLNLESSFRTEFLPELMPEPDPSKAKDEFAEWIVGNGFRELKQHFCIYLDQLYEACSWASLAGTVTAVDDARTAVASRMKNMKNVTSLAGKLRKLSDDFSIVSSCEGHFGTLTAARNVVAHALGSVRERDCLAKKALRVTWRGRDFHLAGRILNGGFEPSRVKGGPTEFKMTVVERERVFSLGTKISFSPDDLTKICIMFSDETRVLVVAVEAFVRSRGITINASATASTPSGEVA